MILSVIISMRDEGNNTAFTVHSIINDLETFLSPTDWEIILVDNGSRDEQSWRFLAERGLYYHRNLTVLHDPLMGNVSARNKGVDIAQGEYIFFSDAHMSYRIGAFRAMLDALETHGGIVHPAVQWMGGYDPSYPSWQYSLKVGDRFYGTWNRMQVSLTRPFFIPVSGHCCLGVSRAEFNELHQYHPMFRCYGGGELYLDLKWWMMGRTVMCVPSAVAYHLSAGRGYHYHNHDHLHNMMLLCEVLGEPAFRERIYFSQLSHGHIEKATLDRLHSEALSEGEADKAWLSNSRTISLIDTITKKPWDKRNDTFFGKHASGFLVFEHTWLAGLTPEVRELALASPDQRRIAELCRNEWKPYVYHG